MRIAWIVVLYKTPKGEKERLEKEIKKLHIKDLKLYFIDNTVNNSGFATGVNRGLKKGLVANADIFVISNPDVSLSKLRSVSIFSPANHFDIWSFAMKQIEAVYYGGKFDKWRMSAGLISKTPKRKYIKRDFVSGALMFIKKEVIEKVGFFDESYFLYYEDVDYCIRAKRAGYKIGVDSSQTFNHFEWSRTNRKKGMFLAKNRLKFLLKYGRKSQKMYEILRLPKTAMEYIRDKMKET